MPSTDGKPDAAKRDPTIDAYVPRLSPQGRRWVRFAAVLAGAWAIGWFTLSLSAVLTPLAAAAAVAYICNPLVTRLEAHGVSRLRSVSLGLAALLILLAAGVVTATVQAIDLASNLPRYAEQINRIVVDLGGPAWAQQNWREILVEHGRTAGAVLLAYASAWFSNLTYWLSATVLMPFYLFYLLLNFNAMVAAVRDHLPAAYRPTVVRVVQTADRAMADFFRGRVVVCAAIGVLSAVGWWLAGVPYSFPLGLLSAVLNMIPFAGALALPPALILSYTHAIASEQGWVQPVVLAFGVYMVVQAIESFVLAPLIQAKASGLHGMTTIVALMVGFELAGALGMLLAIPVASTLKSLSIEYVLPEIRRLAGTPPAAAALDAATGGSTAAHTEVRHEVQARSE